MCTNTVNRCRCQIKLVDSQLLWILRSCKRKERQKSLEQSQHNFRCESERKKKWKSSKVPATVEHLNYETELIHAEQLFKKSFSRRRSRWLSFVNNMRSC